MPQRGQALKSPSYLKPAPLLEQYALIRPSRCLQQKNLWIYRFFRAVVSEVAFSGGVVYARFTGSIITPSPDQRY